ncbi:MAG TPA: hypothetical protein VGY53_05645, partial [Isosphaeraceae bacterium]|nr:hypothetical protein [Isosphaeraceae bacterium]
QEDEAVIEEARSSLQFLSRKIDGFGPPSPSTPEDRLEAARKWLTWYSSIRPIDQNPGEELLLGLEPAASSSGQPASAGGQPPASGAQPPASGSQSTAPGAQPSAPGGQPPATGGRTR